MSGRLDPAVAEVRRCVRTALDDVLPGARVLVACSGGADSLALAAGAVFEGNRAGWAVGAIVVDHQQQPGSADVADRTAAVLRELGCEPVEVVAVEVGPGHGPEGAARAARYAALTSKAEAHEAIVLLGHTRDDQAETVLLGLVRGSGVRSLAGMAVINGCLRRPLLSLTREQTSQACRALGLGVWDDPHNADRRFLRVRVRREVLPLLERELGPGVAAALARTARLARDDADALDVLAEDVLEAAQVDTRTWQVDVLAAAFPALRRRVLRRAAVAAGCPAGELFAVHLETVERLVTEWHGQGGIDLPGAVTSRRSAGLLIFEAMSAGRTDPTAVAGLDDRSGTRED
jgi:tRNA(Ile)-lysidine synthetase-like protein